MAKDIGLKYINGKLETTVRLGKLGIGFPTTITLDSLYVEGQKRDTLLYSGHLFVKLDMWGLLSGDVHIDSIQLDDFYANVDRTLPDTTFNFKYIIDAFSSGKAEKEPDTTTSSPQVYVGSVGLQNIRLNYEDAVAGYSGKVDIGKFKMHFDAMDLDDLNFKVDSVILENTTALFVRSEPLRKQIDTKDTSQEDSTITAFPQVKLTGLFLNHVQLHYLDKIAQMEGKADLDSFTVVPNKIDIAHNTIHLQKILMDSSSLAFSMNNTGNTNHPTQEDKNIVEEDTHSPPLAFSLDTLEMVKNHLKYDNIGEPKLKQGMDFNHLEVSNFNLLASNLSYTEDSSHLFLKDLSFQEQSGFFLKKFTTEAVYTHQGISLQQLLLLTSHSRISKKLAVSYPSLGAFSDSLGDVLLDVNLDSTVVGEKDLYYFQPVLAKNKYLSNLTNHPVFLNGSLQGQLKNLQIDSLFLKIGHHTALALQATLKNLLQPEAGYFKVDLIHFNTGRKDLKMLLPKGMLPSTFGIPDRLSLSGDYKGSFNSFQTNLDLKSTDGNAKIAAVVDNLNDSVQAAYRAKMKLDRIKLNQILKNDSLYGPVTLNMALQGKGITLESAKAKLKGTIKQAVYNGYNYKNLVIEGEIEHQIAKLTAKIDDPNLDFSLLAHAGFQDSVPDADFQFSLNKADLRKLHFSDNKLKLKGRIEGNLQQIAIDHPEGTIAFHHWDVLKGAQEIYIDSVLLKAHNDSGVHHLALQSPIAHANISGDYRLSEMGKVFQRLQKKYLAADTIADRKEKNSSDSWKMNMQLQLLPSRLWENIFPDLAEFNGAFMDGSISANPDSVYLHTVMSPFIYNGISVDSVLLDIHPQDNQLRYALAVHQAHDTNMIAIPHLLLNGYLNKKKVYLNLKVKDKKRKDRFHLSGNLKMATNSYTFSLLKDSLLLDYKPWSIPEDNYLSYSPEGLMVHHLKLQNGNQYLSANSDSTEEGSPLKVKFHQFKISNLTDMVLNDSLRVEGEINGHAKVDNLLGVPGFVADMSLDSLSFRDAAIGKLTLKANNEQQKDAYHINVALTGNKNDIQLDGKYVAADSGYFNFKMDMNALSMSTIAAFSMNQISDASGKMTGNLSLQGTMDAPKIDGQLHFKDANFEVTKINEQLQLKNEGIFFDDKGIHLDKFTILNSNKDKAVVDGDIFTQKYNHFRFDLDLKADNFRVINIPKKEGDSFYGKVYLSTNTQITGDNNLPKINMTVKLEDGTDFNYVMLNENPQKVSSEGIVKFIDPEVAFDSSRLAATDSTHHSQAIQGMDLSANIIIDTSAFFNIVMDPVSGDNLFVKGKANLNFTLSPGGNMSLTGRYNLTDGGYNLSFEGLIKKKFALHGGSYIIWEGDPLKAELNITAEYDAKASPLELVENQLSTDNDAMRNRYKQKLPFQVFLHVKGTLMKPKISFELGMPVDARQALNGAVYTRINQINTEPSKVNKQTLGLLVFGHFISDNPLKTSGGGGALGAVRRSANKILSKQLNKLAGNLINGVDIDLALESSKNYSSGKAENQTNLNIGLSKSLFNDRTTVYVGGGIPIEGGSGKKDASSIVGDVAIEYKLSKDGRYRLRAYRKNKYQGVIEGEFIETGVSFIIVMDYNHFKELFKRTDEKGF